MEETASVFWVDLGYRLRSRNEGSTAGFPGMTGIHLILLLLLLLLLSTYLYGSGSAPGIWGRGPGYVRDPPKAQNPSPSINFK